MPTFDITTNIHAPIESCFDLARDIGFHVQSLEHTNERAIAGRTDGLIEFDETVTWQAKHLGMTRLMTVKITAMDRVLMRRYLQTLITKRVAALRTFLYCPA